MQEICQILIPYWVKAEVVADQNITTKTDINRSDTEDDKN